MKYMHILLIILVLSVSNVYAGSKAILFEVFPNSAKVVFEANTSDKSPIVIPGSFQSNTIKIIGTTGNVDIKQFSIKSMTDDTTVPAFLTSLKKQITDTENKLNTVNSKINGLELAAIMLDNMDASKIAAKDLATFIANVSKMREKNAYDIEKLKLEQRTITASLKTLNDTYKMSLPRNWNKSTQIDIISTGTGTVLIEAYTMDASWQPSYKYDLNTNTGNITATLQAKVAQSTGLNWDGKFIFSTNRHTSAINADKLPTLIVDIATEYTPMPIMNKADTMELAYEAAEVSPSAGRVESNSYDTALSKNYILNTKLTSGANLSVVTLDNFVLKADITTVAVPELSQNASINATINQLPLAILPTEADLFVNGEYSQTTWTGKFVAGDEMSLAFGANNNISLNKRQAITTNSSGWTKGSKEYGYTITITNGTNKTENINVVDRIPYSVNSEIEVTNVKISNNGTVNKQGKIEWNITLEPKKTVTLDVSYTIKHPSDEKIFTRDAYN